MHINDYIAFWFTRQYGGDREIQVFTQHNGENTMVFIGPIGETGLVNTKYSAAYILQPGSDGDEFWFERVGLLAAGIDNFPENVRFPMPEEGFKTAWEELSPQDQKLLVDMKADDITSEPGEYALRALQGCDATELAEMLAAAKED